MAMSDAQLHAPTTTRFHHSLQIMPRHLVCCVWVRYNPTNYQELHFKEMTNLNSTRCLAATFCYNIHSMFHEEVRRVRAHIYGAQPAPLNMHAIHNMLSRANTKHICVSFAARADSSLVQYLRCRF